MGDSIPSLFHYQRFEERWLRETLIDKKLYLPSPGAFNDPWDCKPHFDTSRARDPVYRQGLAQYYERITRKKGGVAESDIQERIRMLRDNPSKARNAIEGFARGLQTSILQQWRIYCLTPHSDSELMWAHYGDSHRGVCLGFDGERKPISDAPAVRYLEQYPPFNMIGMDEPHEVMLTKSAAWAYEAERRLIAWERQYATADAEGLISDNGRIPLPDGVLKTVTLGALASEEVAKRVVDLVRESGLPIDVVRAVKVPNQFRLTFKKVR